MQKQKIWFTGILHRVGRTAIGVMLAYVMAAQAISEVNWVAGLSATGMAALASLLTNLVSAPQNMFGEGWIYQLLERAAKTFFQSLLTFMGTAAFFADVDWRIGLDAALLATLASLGMSVLSTKVGEDKAIGQVDVVAPPEKTMKVAA